jgi:hypothetical protein
MFPVLQAIAMPIIQARLVTIFGEVAVRANKTSFLSQYQQYSLLILLGSITGCQSVGGKYVQAGFSTSFRRSGCLWKTCRSSSFSNTMTSPY